MVLEREGQPSKDFLSIDEIKAVILEVRSSLGFTPRKPHCNVYIHSVDSSRLVTESASTIE